MIETSWNHRVADYVDQLDEIAASINELLDQTQLETNQANAAQVDASMNQLRERLGQLEEKIAQREALLKADDAPTDGLTLTDKLQRTRQTEDERLAQRCLRVADRITDANRRAIAIFVCQYHLADLSGELVRLISGSANPSTYTTANKPDPIQGGGLFSESA